MQLAFLLKVVITKTTLINVITNIIILINTVVVVVNANIIKCALSGIIYPKYSMVGGFCGANIIAREWAFNGLASVIKFFALFKENL